MSLRRCYNRLIHTCKPRYCSMKNAFNRSFTPITLPTTLLTFSIAPPTLITAPPTLACATPTLATALPTLSTALPACHVPLPHYSLTAHAILHIHHITLSVPHHVISLTISLFHCKCCIYSSFCLSMYVHPLSITF